MSRFGVASPGAAREPTPVTPLPVPPRRRRLLWLLPVVVVLVAGAVVGGYTWGRRTAPARPATTAFLTTAAVYPAGHLLAAGDLRTITVVDGSAGISPGSAFVTPAGAGRSSVGACGARSRPG